MATKTASMLSSFTNSSNEGYFVGQRQTFDISSQRSGNRSLTAATVTLGWSWNPNDGPNLHTPLPTMPTRIFRSVKGLQTFVDRAEVAMPEAPKIFAFGTASAAAATAPPVMAPASETMATLSRN